MTALATAFKDSIEVRAHARRYLRARAPEEKIQSDAGIQKTLIGSVLPWLESVAPLAGDRKFTLGLIRPIPSEPELTLFEKVCEQQGLRLAYPRLTLSSGDAVALRYYIRPDPGPNCVWAKGPHGIDEPQADWEACPADSMLALLVPGLAFSPRGDRIGRGGGYFDRLLFKCTRPIRIGLVPGDLIFDQLPTQSWDQRVDILVRETGAINCHTGGVLEFGVAPQGRLG